MATLGEDYPKQQARVRMIQQHARDIGPAGGFLVAVCEDLLRRADRAAIAQDLPAMIGIYREMLEMKE